MANAICVANVPRFDNLTSGGMTMQVEYRLCVPLTDNEGHGIPDGCWNVLKNTLVMEFGGFTKYPAIGAWKSKDGEVIEEQIYIFSVITPRTSAASEIMEELANYVKEYWRQLSVLLTKQEINAMFI